MRRLATTLALTMTASAPAALLPVTPASAEREGPRYAALGDSFTSGPLIPRQHGLAGCLRSDHNYPSLLAASLHARLTDVSCTGADTSDMTHPQLTATGVNPAQLDAVTRDTDLVTLGVGGNDIGFTQVVLTCATESLRSPMGAPCARHYRSGIDARIRKTAPKVAKVLRGVHARAPHARVLLVGYMRLLPDAAGCWPLVPFAAGDVPFLNSTERELNTMLRKTAAANGATFVDTYAGTTGHDVCAPPAARWVEGMLPSHKAAPAHPNELGMRQVAARIRSTLTTTTADR
ncbi:SGNH/GDSL hydrolase family protein [Actinomadura logoneensis]|uniref:SGNH/GDSL hydrolase family protein n=1 Tax=Actinomadura logoneensis TaxID=2293572 RepID=A0A372JMQ5_9ACTN|nr:SGNH/GDSL hydrolase family protein [Actinomadura logoneensis]RFU41287.1 SGNH/GDSL hydrolase family protein [Actinomadura logoneensis]